MREDLIKAGLAEGMKWMKGMAFLNALNFICLAINFLAGIMRPVCEPRHS